MSIDRTHACRGLALAAGLAAFCFFSGCASTQRPEATGPADLGAAGPSGFEKFVLGEAKEQEGINTPYGLAIFDGKLYVCDVGKRRVQVLDLQKHSFGSMTEDRRLVNPVNIQITEDGTKYVADPTAGAVFVFDAGNTLQAILGKEARINPIDVAVRGPYCYVTDFASNRVVVLDKTTGKEIRRLGEQGDGEKQFRLISDLAFGPDGALYVTDKLKGKIFQFDPSGNLKRTIAKLGDNIDELVRPKGIAVDRDNRIWVIDAGVSLSPSAWSTEVAKIYDQEGRLLLFFGRPGKEPGHMNLPAKIVLDYQHVDLFRPYAVKGANIEFLVLVSNQYGPNKINVYGFGEFPAPGKSGESTPTLMTGKVAPLPSTPAAQPPALPAPKVEPPMDDAEQLRRTKAIADVYYRSMELYRAARLEEARAGFVRVLESGLVPPPMEQAIRGYIQDIDNKLASRGGAGR